MGLFGKKKQKESTMDDVVADSGDFGSSESPSEDLSRKERKAIEKEAKGKDLISLGEYDKALVNLEKSIKKGNVSPDVYILKAMLEYRPLYPGSTSDMGEARKVFEKYPGVSVDYGVHSVSTDRMALECDLLHKATTAMGSASCDPTIENGQALINIGNRYLSEIGEDNLVFDLIFKNVTQTGKRMAYTYIARGYETLSDAVKWDDPKKAAEYQQQALFYNQDLNDLGAVDANKSFIEGTSKTVHCWFCGKEVTGKDIHFVSMPSMITKPILDQTDESATIPTNDMKNVYACRACFSSIDNNGALHENRAVNRSKEYTDNQITTLRTYTDERFSQVYMDLNDVNRNVVDVNNRLNSLIRQLGRR